MSTNDLLVPELGKEIANRLNIKMSEEVSRLAERLIKDLKGQFKNLIPDVNKVSAKTESPKSSNNEQTTKIFHDKILTKLYKNNELLGKLYTALINPTQTVQLDDKIGNIGKNLNEFLKKSKEISVNSNNKPEKKQQTPTTPPVEKSELEKVQTIQPVEIKQIDPKALDALGEKFIDILPKAIKEGLTDLNKTINKLSKSLSESISNIDTGGGVGGGILEGLGLSSLFGGGKGTPKGGKPGTPAKGQSVKRGGPKGLGLLAAAGGLAAASGLSWLAGKALGRDEEFEKVETEDLKVASEEISKTGTQEQKQTLKVQTKEQKKQVGIEMAQEGAGLIGYQVGAKAVTKLTASTAARNVWAVFLRFVKRKAPSLFAKLGAKLVAAAGLATVPVVGWIGAAVNIGFTLWTAWDIYTLWKEFSALSDIERQYYANDDKTLSDEELPKTEAESTDKQSLQTPKETAAPRNRAEAAAAAAAKVKAETKQPEAASVTPKETVAPRNRAEAAAAAAAKVKAETKQPEAAIQRDQKTTVSPINVDKNLPLDDKKSAELDPGIENWLKSSESDEFIKRSDKFWEERKAQKTEEKKKLEEEFNILTKQLEEEKLAQTSFMKLDHSDKQEVEKYKIRDKRISELRTKIIPIENSLESINKFLEKTELQEPKLMAKGGVVTKPTNAIVGEAGPEAVVPLDKYTSFNNKETNNILQTIASNTGTTNGNLAGLINGFNNLAKALKDSGTIEKAPVVVNNTPAPQKQSPTSAQVANLGNSDISNFRMSLIEPSRFQPA